MIKQFKFTLLLLVLNLITFLVLFILSNNQFNDYKNEEMLSSLISSFTSNIEKIKISGENFSDETILNKINKKWYIESPFQWTANQFAVNEIIQQLNLMEEKAVFSVDELKKTNQSLADYGLENPLLSLELFQENKSLIINIGLSTALGNKIYMFLPNKKRVYVVENNLLKNKPYEIEDLRQKTIFDIPKFEISSLYFQISNSMLGSPEDLSVRINKNLKDSAWYFESPLEAYADQTLVSEKISALTSIDVIKFLDPTILDEALLGFDKPTMKISIQGNKKRQTLILGNKVTNKNQRLDYYAKLESNDSVFIVDSKIFNELVESQKELRNKDFIKFNPDSLSSIEILDAKKTINLQKLENDEWQIVESRTDNIKKPINADKNLIASLIEDLNLLRAYDFFSDYASDADLLSLGFSNPLSTIQLSDKNGPILNVKFVKHPSKKNLLLAKIKEDSTVYSVIKTYYNNYLLKDASHYRNRILEKLPFSAKIIKLKIIDLNDTRISFNYPSAFDYSPLKQKALSSLIKELKIFKVKEYINDEDIETDWKYKLIYEISYPGDESNKIEEREFLISSRNSGSQQIAFSEKLDMLIALNPNTIEHIYSLLNNLEIDPKNNDIKIESIAPIEELPELKIAK